MHKFFQVTPYVLGIHQKRDECLLAAIMLFLSGIGMIFQAIAGWRVIDTYCTTMLAFSYGKYGFFRRGLQGSLFHLICTIFPGAWSVDGAVLFLWGGTVVYLFALFVFCHWLLTHCNGELCYKAVFFMILFFLEFLVPTVCYAGGAFGRADLLQMAVCLLSIYLLTEQKYVWATVPLTAVNVLFHEGYLCMTFGAVLSVLIYRVFGEERGKHRYALLLIANVFTLGILTVLSLKLSHAGTLEDYMSAAYSAQELHFAGGIHVNLLSILSGYSEDVITTDDSVFRNSELLETPIFLAILLPVLMFFWKFVAKLFKNLKGSCKNPYICLLLCPLALIFVEFIIFCDFGRYVFWLFFCYFTILAALLVMKDEPVTTAVQEIFSTGFCKTLLCTDLFYQPLLTTCYCFLSNIILALLQ